MNPALERAAKALHRRNGYARPDPHAYVGWDRAWDELFETQREIYRDLVREVVKEIREPTSVMVTAARRTQLRPPPGDDLGHFGDVWRLMIDELLK